MSAGTKYVIIVVRDDMNEDLIYGPYSSSNAAHDAVWAYRSVTGGKGYGVRVQHLETPDMLIEAASEPR